MAKREYWSVGKPGFIWCFLDLCEHNEDLFLQLSKKYPRTSEYFNKQGKMIAVTFEVPTIELLRTFSKVD